MPSPARAGILKAMHTPDSDPVIPCVIPAAGRSSRMGDFKPLLPWKGTTICGAVVDTVLAAGLAPVLVSGYRADDLALAFGRRSEVLLAANPEWEAGMVGSIQAGCRAALARWPGLPGLLVAPADMPELPVRAFRALAEEGLARVRDAAEPAALFASKDGKLGHPVWIPGQFLETILDLPQGGQLKTHLMARLWLAVELKTEAIFLDIDTQADYREGHQSV